MGYNHYWRQPVEIEPEAFALIVTDFQRCVLALDDAGVPLAGPMGDDLPQIDHTGIAFNGVRDCGHPKNEAISIPFPSEDASGVGGSADAVADSWFIGVQIRRRTCNGDCSYEPFIFKRVVEPHETNQRTYDYCKTGFRPYDLAVQCTLLIAKHHLRDNFEVYSSGSDWHWNDARRVCYLHLDYPLVEFKNNRDEGLIEG
jgi:hypothetical protein